MRSRQPRNPDSPDLFARVNDFVGHHVECSDVGQQLAYAIDRLDGADRCNVTVTCLCGGSARFASTSEQALALTEVARSHNIRVTQCLA